nr:GDSL-type esterase/lipase family protein [bacterium]
MNTKRRSFDVTGVILVLLAVAFITYCLAMRFDWLGLGPNAPLTTQPPVQTQQPSPTPVITPELTPSPTPEITPAPTPTPTPEPTPSPTPPPVTPRPVPDTSAPHVHTTPTPLEMLSSQYNSFFDDALFMGDSVTGGMYYHVMGGKELGEAKFVLAGAYAAYKACKGEANTKYAGQSYTPAQAVQVVGAKKLFILLGLNDLPLYSVEDTVANYKSALEQILSANPGLKIYVQSTTPVVYGGAKWNVSNARINELNAGMQNVCRQLGVTYVDIASALMDEEGYLRDEYCTDGYVHLTTLGNQVWLNELRKLAR